MSTNTKIEWADHTFNPWVGCTKVSPACDHCYAEGWAKRSGQVTWGPGAERRRTSAANWRLPLKWNAEAQRLGIRYRVFCASLADVFDNAVNPQWRIDLFELIRATPNLDWLLLTKRIGNAKAMIDATISAMDIGYAVPFCAWPYPNVWIGATVVNQEEADRDIHKLLAVPAAKRFLSMEPLLGPVDLGAWIEPWNECGSCGASFDFEPDRPDKCQSCGTTGCMCTGFGSGLRYEFDNADGRIEVPDEPGIHWVIVGGESGPGARPMHPDWARSLRDQCEAAGVPFLFKQWGEWAPARPEIELISSSTDHKFDDGTWMEHVGKKAAGRLLDGRTWDEVPA